MDGAGWNGLPWNAWTEADVIRARLQAGADPHAHGRYQKPALHTAAASGSPEVLGELIRYAVDVDVDKAYDGRTALWEAVHAGNGANARALQEAGADVLHVGPDGWTPWRLSLVSHDRDLLDREPGLPGLFPEEADRVGRGRVVMGALEGIRPDGFSIACVGGVDSAEVVRRLGAWPVSQPATDAWGFSGDGRNGLTQRTVGVTDVPGGSVVCQPWGFAASARDVLVRISPGTVCYSMYANPKSGNQGSIARDGVLTAADLHPGGGPGPDDPEDQRFREYLYRGAAPAYCCAFVGLEPSQARAVTGPPDLWVELPGTSQ